MSFEYTVIPAPARMKRQKGANTAAERLAVAMEDAINEMAAEGWEYLRTETMTVEDKAGRFSKIVEKIETVLVFRREAQTRPERVAPPIMSEAPKAKPAPLFKARTAGVQAAPIVEDDVEIKPEAKVELQPSIIEPQLRPETAEPTSSTTQQDAEIFTPSLGGVSRD